MEFWFRGDHSSGFIEPIGWRLVLKVVECIDLDTVDGSEIRRFASWYGEYPIIYRVLPPSQLHPGRLTWNIIMEVWKIIFLSKWVICRFHVNLPGCTCLGFLQAGSFLGMKLNCPRNIRGFFGIRKPAWSEMESITHIDHEVSGQIIATSHDRFSPNGG